MQALERRIVVVHYSTGVKMFKNIKYSNARGVSTVRTQSGADCVAGKTVRYYCCENLQEIHTDRTTCMPQNLQASQYSYLVQNISDRWSLTMRIE